ncbi:TPA: hypothetical protein N0F65_006695 [Lagenidium giganteum]|uniref:Uncharacterized protein n=1 Tax=Lagenidium giganteum TaxID=4803 RepID=A0AAV2Z968_9STRA|nr:TPA: hypothetical protein N0F65_006695 [Lagenidium giganteum]
MGLCPKKCRVDISGSTSLCRGTIPSRR